MKVDLEERMPLIVEYIAYKNEDPEFDYTVWLGEWESVGENIQS